MAISTLIQHAVEAAAKAGELPAELLALPIQVERPNLAEHGDWSTSIALQGAKLAKRKPREIAALLLPYLEDKKSGVEKVEIAGAGFINFWMSSNYWFSSLQEVFEAGDRYGQGTIGRGKRALVEFVSANPTGPLHIGHGRGAVVGDVMANILSWGGYAVDREYYVNDGGVQISLLGASIAGRCDEVAGRSGTFPENGYRGDYIRDIAKRYHAEGIGEGMSPEERIGALGRRGGDEILQEILADLGALGVRFDSVFHESELYKSGRVEAVLTRLAEKGLSYEKDGALWFATSRFGDDKDRVLRKQEGAYTYFTPDIAYHDDKLARGYDLLVNVWGADHGGYLPRMKAAFRALEIDPDRLQVLLIQMVQLISEGKKVSMSTRAGEFEELAVVRHEVGKDVTRYFFSMRSHQAQLDFDLDLAKQESAENPVYYIQYAHARISSIFKKAALERSAWIKAVTVEALMGSDCDFLPEEIALMKKVLEFPELVQSAATLFEPHRPAFYLLELAKLFQTYYSRARADKRYQVLQDDPLLRQRKLAILAAVAQALKNGLAVLGIQAPDEM